MNSLSEGEMSGWREVEMSSWSEVEMKVGVRRK